MTFDYRHLVPAASAAGPDAAVPRFGIVEWFYAAAVVQTVLFNPIVASVGSLQIYLNSLTWPLLALVAVLRWGFGPDSELSKAMKSLLIATGATLWLTLLVIGFGPEQPHAVANLLRLLYVPMAAIASLAAFRASDRLLDVAVVALGVKGALELYGLFGGPIDILHRLTVTELGGHNTFGAFLVFLIMLRGATWVLGGRRPRPLVLASLLVCVVCVLLTFSRAAFLALVVGLATLTVTALWRSGKARQSRRGGLLLMAAALAPVVIAGPLQERLTSVGLNQSSGRTELWQPAWDGFVDAPVVGHGFGSFEAYSSSIVDLADPTRIGAFTYSAHSLPLQILYEGGFVGLLLVAWAVGLVLRRCWHPVMLPVCAAVLIDSLFETFPYVVQCSWVLGLALAVGLRHRVAAEEAAAAPAPSTVAS